MSHRRVALLVIAAALALDTVCGCLYAVAEHLPLWHGLYAALANAVTLGSDVNPVNAAGYVINTAECFTIVPLFAASVSLFTSSLTEIHVRKAERRIKLHTESMLAAVRRPDA